VLNFKKAMAEEYESKCPHCNKVFDCESVNRYTVLRHADGGCTPAARELEALEEPLCIHGDGVSDDVQLSVSPSRAKE
jgi:hypothetical protein